MKHVAIQDTYLFCREKGEGPPALFLAGFNLNGTLWLDQMADLADQRRCVALDLRGYGQSEAITWEGSLDMDLYIDDVIEFIEKECAGEPVDLVGFSQSAMIGAWVAEKRPDLVRSLSMLSAGFGGPMTDSYERYWNEMAMLTVREGIGPMFRRFASYIVASDANMKVLARYREMLKTTRVDMIMATLRPTGRSNEGLAGRLKVPVLMVAGTDDVVLPMNRAEEIAAQIPDGRAVEIDGSGRLSPLEAPRELSAALRHFWTSVEA